MQKVFNARINRPSTDSTKKPYEIPPIHPARLNPRHGRLHFTRSFKLLTNHSHFPANEKQTPPNRSPLSAHLENPPFLASLVLENLISYLSKL